MIMNTRKFWVRLAFVFLVGLAPVSCSKNRTRPGGETSTMNSGASREKQLAGPGAKPWDDWLVLQEDQYVPVVDEIGRNFELARSSFLRMDFSTAGSETRKAAAFLKAEMAAAQHEEKERLKTTIRELDQLAAQLDHQSVESLARMDEVFAKAYQADMEHSWTLVGFERWKGVARAPQAHFRLAEQDLLHKDYDSAAKEIRRAAGLLKLEATRATAEGKSNLNASRQELIKLASEVQSHSLTGSTSLHRPFAAASYALADSHYLKAIQDWTCEQPRNSGHELEAAAINLAEGAEWAGHGAEFESSLVVKDALALGKKLVDGGIQTARQIAPEVRSLGSEIENLRKGIRPQA